MVHCRVCQLHLVPPATFHYRIIDLIIFLLESREPAIPKTHKERASRTRPLQPQDVTTYALSRRDGFIISNHERRISVSRADWSNIARHCSVRKVAVQPGWTAAAWHTGFDDLAFLPHVPPERGRAAPPSTRQPYLASGVSSLART